MINLFPSALRADVDRRLKKYHARPRSWKFRYYLAHPQYRTLVWYRLFEANPGIARRIFETLYRRSSLRSGLEILTPHLGGGVIMPHWGRIVLNAKTIGDNLYVFHNVTVGNDYQSGRPSLGDNVFLGTGSVLLGDITIGDNVIIGAGSMVRESIPANSLAAGNPARVIREIDPDTISKLIGY